MQRVFILIRMRETVRVCAGVACPAGSYCAGASAGTAACTCAPGFACAAGGSDPGGTTCPATFFCVGGASIAAPCTTAGAELFAAVSEMRLSSVSPVCPPVVSDFGWLSAGALAVWHSVGFFIHSSVGMLVCVLTGCCALAGYFCVAGSSSPTSIACSAGYFGTEGVSYSTGTCGGLCTCAAGSYCPSASVSAAGVLVRACASLRVPGTRTRAACWCWWCAQCPAGTYSAGGAAQPVRVRWGAGGRASVTRRALVRNRLCARL